MKTKITLISIILLLISCQISFAQSRRSSGNDGAKFGFFDMREPALGLRLNLGHVSPHLRAQFDGDLILSGQPRAILDVSLRYMFERQRYTQPYVGGGLGAALGDDNSIPAHLVGGFNFTIDTLPVFVEMKIHLSRPDAVSLWFGYRFQ
ncbi:MAG: hypothetical protein H6695_15580 [Deferribacteres bacterium]|nr:hypothetical protein [candidate division KSB1 bacterium]MCB9511610.1 hypothetical protein [Deferribacteres bacterium]